jgi:hypothetical protein
MFGFTFYLDNQLSIKHDAPKKTHPEWQKLREDISRFVFEKNKLESQEPTPGMARLKAENLDPYPGEFLKEDLQDRIFHSNLMLAIDYLSQGDNEGAQECLNNISAAKASSNPGTNPFKDLLHLQKTWKDLMEYFSSEKVRLEISSQIGFGSE